MLPAPADMTGHMWDINNLGQVLGYIVNQGWSAGRAVVWDRGRMTDLGTLGGPSSGPAAINDRGQIVGNSDTADSQSHPFLWDHDG